MAEIAEEVESAGRIPAIPTILDVVCRTTGMGFAAVARVTENRWIACAVLDHIRFGLEPGGELDLTTTICHEIRQQRQPVVIDHVDEDPLYRSHHTPACYGFQSYISFPILLPDGRFFGTLCAIDPKPASLKTPAITGMFRLFAELIAFHIDVAEKLRVSEEDLRKEQDDSKLREQFIAVLGHDLRGPLGAITMGTALLREGKLAPHAEGLVDMMEKSAGRMSGLIDDVMDFARGRLGQGISLEGLSQEPVDHLLEQVLDEIRTGFPDRGITTRFDLREPFPHDPKRFSQLVANLVSNAMTHGRPERDVEVTAVCAGGNFVFSVANAAAPIPPHLLGRLFEPFNRGDMNDSREGLGLGLYIASQIAKSHGGKLEVVSDEKETRFTFSASIGSGSGPV
ncbi:GAF domain-containing sensor histidine kinase [Luteolibacter yonseiensis]|uniref:histidine kinase n=1 Tax=Luteolibacter yonseiensis TaxID=1144680 RepID=A0A934R2X1_9BACT|nr:GAF domain-containing sensor histidine kinase [Luteolibacter yonseiensis]MBK1814515.1 GAF domain-containing sensor histidine kinase [Luteolibacter yonseiensis]